eukprot:1557292-Amphidinium_carterae.1
MLKIGTKFAHEALALEILSLPRDERERLFCSPPYFKIKRRILIATYQTSSATLESRFKSMSLLCTVAGGSSKCAQAMVQSNRQYKSKAPTHSQSHTKPNQTKQHMWCGPYLRSSCDQLIYH